MISTFKEDSIFNLSILNIRQETIFVKKITNL